MINKVIHIVWGFRLGGIETMLVNIMNEQVKHTSVMLIVINDLIDEQLLAMLDSKVRIVCLRRAIGSRNPIPILRLNAILWREKADVVHCHTHTIINLIATKFHRRAVLTVHTTIQDKYLRASDLQKYAKIFAISPSVQQMLEVAFGVKSAIVYNGIDFSKFSQKNSFELHSPFRIVQVGRLIAPKGHITLLQAISQLRHLNISLDIVGEGVEEQRLKEFVANAGIENQVKFCGSMNQQELHEQLKNYDLLVQPSLFEGFGLTIIEAMAARVPVLVSSIDSLSDVVCKGRYGRIFQAEDPDDCATQIADIIAHPYTEERLDEAYNYAKENFDVKQTANKYLNKYNKL